ncbi:MAG: ATPase, T2SS/T4P/T4SS family [Clostridium sp.]
MLDWNKNQKKRIGDMLLASNVISEVQLKDVLTLQKSSGKKIGELLIEKRYITEEELAEFLSKQLNIELVSLTDISINNECTQIVSKEISERYKIMPFELSGNKLSVAMSDPLNIMAIDDLKIMTRKRIIPYIDTLSSINKSIKKYYNKQDNVQTIYEIEKEMKIEYIRDKDEEISLEEIENAPTVKLTNSILVQAIEMGASDIHIEPFEKQVIIRYRVDGTLHENMKIPKNLFQAVSTRFKITSGMNIAEKRIPQDGRIEMIVKGIEYDFRMNTLPTIYGEKIVIRILDKKASLLNMDNLKFDKNELLDINKILSVPNGIVLVTGPTGSGKTTTLYSFLKKVNTEDKNLITIEDPVEYTLDRINQVQVNAKTGLTFAAGLRSILRQDPDIIMIGEIRDEETAQIAIRASITGHLVFSTIHTNDAPSTITRLLDMGIKPYLVADALSGIIAQRLVRKLCPYCKEAYMSTEEENGLLRLENSITLHRVKGCSHCNGIGYSGRRAVYEILRINMDLKRIIEKNGSMDEIRQAALNAGMTSLNGKCKELLLNGEISINEFLRTVDNKE